MPLPLIHIGYMKTGSTWLQDHLFADGGPYRIMLPERDVRRLLVRPMTFAFDAGAARDEMQAALKAVSAGHVPVISVERLSGSTVSAGYDSREIADRLRTCFDDAQVLIVVREQEAMILSAWKQYVRECGTTSLRRFLDMAPRGGAKIPLFDPGFFEYDRLVAYYRQLFGDERVQVLCYEMLRETPDEFVASINGFCGVQDDRALPADRRSNVALSNCAAALRARTNLIACRDMNNPGAWFHSDMLVRIIRVLTSLLPRSLDARLGRRYRRVAREAVGDRFVASNRRLQALTGLELADHGYRVDED